MIPNELIETSRWLGHQKKIPIDPKTGSAASSTDPATWADFDTAKAFVEAGKADGLGFVLQAPYIGVDLDHSVENGVINDFAKDIIRKCNSYTEYSPSGTGVHIFLKGHLPRAYKRPGLEVYQTGRYFTVTGRAVLPLRPIREVDFESLEIVPKEELRKPLDIVKTLAEVRNGSRDNDFSRLAGSLRDRGYRPEEMFAFLQARAQQVDFTDEDLWKVCKSIGRYEPTNQPEVEDADSIEDFLKDEQTVEWLCKPFFAKGCIHFVAGLPEALKTWCLIDLAVVAASGGGLWLGKYPVKGAKVLFVDQERFKGETQRRFRGLMAARALSPISLREKLFLRCGTSTKLDLDNSYNAFRKALDKIKPDIVIIDSFATIHTKEESNRMEIQSVLERIKQLRKDFGCAFIFVHHETKGVLQKRKEGGEVHYLDMAGNVAISAAAEIAINVVKHDTDSSFVHHTKSTLSSKEPPFLVKISDVESGVRLEAI